MTRSEYFLAKLDAKRQLDPTGALRDMVTHERGFSPNTLTTNPRKPECGVRLPDLKWVVDSVHASVHASQRAYNLHASARV